MYSSTQSVLSSERQENNEGGLNLILFLCWKVQTPAVLLLHANSSFCFVHLTFVLSLVWALET